MHRSSLPLLLAVVVSTASSAEPARLGAGGGLVVTPTFFSSTPVFFAGLLSFEVDLPLGRHHLRLSPMVGGGVAPPSARSFRGTAATLGALQTDVQYRFAFTEHVSAGLGALVGLAFGDLGTTAAAGVWLGPSLTPLAVQFAGHHELSLWLGVTYWPGASGVAFAGALPALRYAYFF